MGKLIDALYYLVVTAIIGGFVVQGALKLTPTLEHTFGTAAARVPHSWALPLAIIGLLTLNLLLERILPLRALSEAHWVYTARPARRMPGFDGLSWVQLGLVGGVAALVGVGQGMWWQYAVIAVLSRFMMGMRNWTLAQLLAAGVTRSVGLGGLSVQDSELVSQAFAQCAITNNPKVWLAVRSAGNPWLLVARRYGRRFYLPLLAVIIVCLSLSMAPTWPQVAAVVFLLAWSILGAGIVAAAWAFCTRASRRATVSAGLIGAVSWLLFLWLVTHRWSVVAATGAAALSIGVASAVAARLLRVQLDSISASAVVPILPGLVTWSGVLKLALVTGEGSFVDGQLDLMTAAAVGIVLAAGVAAGAAMARPMSVPIRKLPWPIRPLGSRGVRKR